MDKIGAAKFVHQRLGSRLTARVGKNWRLDGDPKPGWEIWQQEVVPLLEAEGINLDFPQNYNDIYAVMGKVRVLMRGLDIE